MTRHEHQEIIAQLFDRLHREFGRMAPQIIQVMVECVGGCRLTFPDLQDIWRQERNRRIRLEFNGANVEELAILYRLTPRMVRYIVNRGVW